MGCDIHICVERKIDGVWRLVGSDAWVRIDFKTFTQYIAGEVSALCEVPARLLDPISARRYGWFSFLANVLCPVRSPVQFRRGIPEDACYFTKRYHKELEEGYHNAGHATAEEILRHPDTVFCYDEKPCDVHEQLEAVREISKLGEIRFVFWFDN